MLFNLIAELKDFYDKDICNGKQKTVKFTLFL